MTEARAEASPGRSVPVMISSSGLPAGEARTLLAHVLGVPPGQLIMVEAIGDDQAAAFAALVARRVAGEPIQHLTGRAWFRHTDVEVGPGVFVPRPETEVMTGWMIDRLNELIANGHDHPVVVDLCTGSGVIARALATEVPTARVHAVELSDVALGFAERNLAGLGVDLRGGDMADAFTDLDGTVDAVIANPPYIPLAAWESVAAEVRDHDPQLALFSGADGLDAMRVVVRTAARLLHADGVVAAEHAEVQHDSAPAVFVASGAFDRVRDHVDLAGRPRFVTGVRRGRPASEPRSAAGP